MTDLASVLPDDPLRVEVEQFVRAHRLSERSTSLDAHPEFPWEEYRSMGRAGWLGLTLPIDRGGRELPLRRAGVVLQEFGYRAGTAFAKLSLQPEFTSVIGAHGTADLRARFADPLARGELLISNQVTEPQAGSDLSRLSARVERQGDQLVLSGTKSQVAFAADAQAALVYVRPADGVARRGGVSAYIVPQDLPGIRREVVEDLGERWMRRGTVTYDSVRISSDHLVGESGRALDYLQVELTHERALLGAIYLGVARASWEETVREVGERVVFEEPLSHQEAVAFPLVEDGTRLAAAWLYTERVLERLDRGERADDAAAMSKWLATHVALTTLDHAIQFHGGRGYSKELPHEQRWRDVRSGMLAHGTSEVMHRVAARRRWPPAR
ncbi:MAG: acyl-CoA/acyl-ACP dehydrogenase, partial [Thermoplasmata archaeon]|nr:acyl-CoA/acyl-ACP dehydrogenase [Thermoplasmata archaeon]